MLHNHSEGLCVKYVNTNQVLQVTDMIQVLQVTDTLQLTHILIQNRCTVFITV